LRASIPLRLGPEINEGTLDRGYLDIGLLSNTVLTSTVRSEIAPYYYYYLSAFPLLFGVQSRCLPLASGSCHPGRASPTHVPPRRHLSAGSFGPSFPLIDGDWQSHSTLGEHLVLLTATAPSVRP
jgi:hypothetical protein